MGAKPAAAAPVPARPSGGGRKKFFFEKKNQKTFTFGEFVTSRLG
jgi:hypothetical protein